MRHNVFSIVLGSPLFTDVVINRYRHNYFDDVIQIGQNINIMTVTLSDGVTIKKLSSTKAIIFFTLVKYIVKYNVVFLKNNLKNTLKINTW